MSHEDKLTVAYGIFMTVAFLAVVSLAVFVLWQLLSLLPLWYAPGRGFI